MSNYRSRLFLLLTTLALLIPPGMSQAEGNARLPRNDNGWSMTEDYTLHIKSNAGWLNYQKSEFYPEPVRLVIGKGVTKLEFTAEQLGTRPCLAGELAHTAGIWGISIHPKEIVVEEGNKTFIMDNGMLINTRTHTVILGEDGLTEAVIPEGITDIGTWAFTRSGIRSVQFPASLKRIHRNAFEICEWLTQVQFPDALTSIGESAFERCIALNEIVLPPSLCEIGDFAFADCEKVSSIAFPEALTSIGYCAFAGTAIQELQGLPDGLESMQGFTACASLQKIELPEGLKSIGWGAFEGCSALEAIEIPDSVTEIRDYAFSGCTALQSIVIPEGVTKIPLAAFQNCTALEAVVIPDTVTEIQESAFEGCSGLKQVRLPANLKVLGTAAFYHAGLRSVELPAGLQEIQRWSLQCVWVEYLELPEGCRVGKAPEPRWPLGQKRYGGTFGVYLKTLVVRARKPVFSEDTILNYHLEHLLFFGMPPKTFTDQISKDCTVYCLDKYETYWSPEGERTWQGFPLVVLTAEEMEETVAALKREAAAESALA